jgi:ubiquinone/menaquinone biosynthesis C-methylase UbiE
MAVQDKFDNEKIRGEVRKHYGNMASRLDGAGSASCCSQSTDTTPLIYEIPEVGELPLEVRSLSAGCGDPITLAELQPGQTVLDLGSGGGIDCFLAAQKVGPEGHVIGVDMTPEMLTKARANKERMGMENVDFRLGEIEHIPVADESVDVIISNCVINLSPDKPQVLREAHRVLRSGGKFAVSDIVADGPLPELLQGDVASWAGCVAGAMDHHEFLKELEHAGFVDVEISPQTLDENLVADFLGADVVELGDSVEQKPKININGEWVTFDLGDRKLPFSARITARKP